MSSLPQVLVLLQEQLGSPVVDPRSALVRPGKEAQIQSESDDTTCASLVSQQVVLILHRHNKSVLVFGSRDTHKINNHLFIQISSVPSLHDLCNTAI